MSDNTSVIDAIKLIAKATKEDSDKMSDIAKAICGSCFLEPEMAPWYAGPLLLLLRLLASAAAAPRETSVQRRAWKGGVDKASAKFQGCLQAPRRVISLCYRLLHRPRDRPLPGRQAGPELVGGRRLRTPPYLLRMQRLPLCRPRRGRYTLYMAVEEDLVNRFRSSLPAAPRTSAPARPTPQLEALLPPLLLKNPS